MEYKLMPSQQLQVWTLVCQRQYLRRKYSSAHRLLRHGMVRGSRWLSLCPARESPDLLPGSGVGRRDMLTDPRHNRLPDERLRELFSGDHVQLWVAGIRWSHEGRRPRPRGRVSPKASSRQSRSRRCA